MVREYSRIATPSHWIRAGSFEIPASSEIIVFMGKYWAIILILYVFVLIDSIYKLQRNIPEPDLSGLREQLKEDWKKWLDNPNLKLEWLAECKARDEAEERKRLELAKQDEEIAINQMQIDCSMIDERNTIVIVDDDDDDLDRVDQAGISSSNARISKKKTFFTI